MELPDRLKIMRESLGKTQKEMAAFLDIAPRTWQNYEEGVHDPSWKVILKLVRAGIKANWLITGTGVASTEEVWENTDVPGFGERLISVRKEFGKDKILNELSINEDMLSKYEKEEDSPDINIIARMCRKFRINPSWLILGELPRYHREYDYDYKDIEVGKAIDVHVLRGILSTIKESEIEMLKEGLIDEETFLNIEDYSELIAFLYEDSLENESKGEPIVSKKAKVKRLFRIARELKK